MSLGAAITLCQLSQATAVFSYRCCPCPAQFFCRLYTLMNLLNSLATPQLALRGEGPTAKLQIFAVPLVLAGL